MPSSQAPFHSSPSPITILRLPSTSLATYPRLDELVALLNNAFVTSWHTIPGLVGDDATRYEASEQFVEEMGATGVTWVAFDEGGKMVATAGYRPWDIMWKTLERLKVQQRVSGENVKEKEVVSPNFYWFLNSFILVLGI